MFKILSFLTVVIALLLISVIIFCQKPKGRITPSGGGSGSMHRIGMYAQSDFWEKVTWVLIGLLLSVILLFSLYVQKASHSGVIRTLLKSDKQRKAKETEQLQQLTKDDKHNSAHKK